MSRSYIKSNLACVITGGLFCHYVYALGTAKTDMIKVDKKYQFDKYGFTQFMIIDHNGKHYNVSNSIWYLKWNSIEDWHKLKTSTEQDKDIIIKYYGWRVPLFGMFPNIVISQHDKITNTNANTEDIILKINKIIEKQYN
jgi:hypothetical protein